jgi:predicted RND superfamily exporter protein
MWAVIARTILRYRAVFVWLILAFTYFMYQQSANVRLSYEMARLLPPDSETQLDYNYFVDKFGESDNLMLIGVDIDSFFVFQKFSHWQNFSESLKTIDGVNNVFSIVDAVNLKKNEKEKKFESYKIFELVKNQSDLDKSFEKYKKLPFYNDRFINNKAAVLILNLDDKFIGSSKRKELISSITSLGNLYSKESTNKIYYSGLPYLRTTNSEMIRNEVKLFIILAMLVTAIILFIFFRSIKAMFISMLIVAIGVTWSFGSLAILNYEITILSALIPPLLIVIGVPNSIFLINKYHNEFKAHGNKSKALVRMIKRVGNITILTNTTTALGFATFILTSSQDLRQFGLVASINIFAVFFLSLLLIPILLSYISPPKQKHTKHLDRKWIHYITTKIIYWVTHRREHIYVYTIIIAVVAFFGLLKMKTSGNITDDIPKDTEFYQGISFFEKNFNSVLPFEITIDTHRKNGMIRLSTLKKIDMLVDTLSTYPQFSRSISMIDAVKFFKQAVYNGNSKFYELPNSQEKGWLLNYADNSDVSSNWMETFLDKDKQVGRVSLQVVDIGTKEMNEIRIKLRDQIDQIFDKEKYNVKITGSSVVFLEGTTYLVKNLFTSLFLAILLISLFMAWMFNSFRMVMVSLIPNLIPLLLTAAIMGYFGIAIKPSTILVFGIAFGISVDDTIHFLAKYRQELKLNGNIRKSVKKAIRETGVSMIYTSIVLFFGFSIFITSQFGGTIALGLLVSLTLMIALLSNLVLLPALLLTLEKSIFEEAIQDPLAEILDEEEDIELKELTFKNPL